MRTKPLVLAFLLAAGIAVLTAGAVTATADETTAATLDVTQADDGSATVTVTENETAVANSTVVVEAVENYSYVGAGEYHTDENGTVELPAPENDTRINVTATLENETLSTEAALTAVTEEEESESEDNFGQNVSSFVHSVLGDNETDGQVGQFVSNFVLDNNPAADRIPGHAGPPENQTGPPAHAGGDNESDQGPPEDAGPDSDSDTGPPEHAGPDTDDEAESEQDDEEAEDDGERGPPDHAGPP